MNEPAGETVCLGRRGRGGGLGLGRTVAFIPESDEKPLRSFKQGSDRVHLHFRWFRPTHVAQEAFQ